VRSWTSAVRPVRKPIPGIPAATNSPRYSHWLVVTRGPFHMARSITAKTSRLTPSSRPGSSLLASPTTTTPPSSPPIACTPRSSPTSAPSPPSTLVTNSTNSTVKIPWATAASPFTTSPHTSSRSPATTRSPSTHSPTTPRGSAAAP
jgi:hypothetical protein